jgi:hypothetical protein
MQIRKKGDEIFKKSSPPEKSRIYVKLFLAM